MNNSTKYPQIIKNILSNCIDIPQTYKEGILGRIDDKSYSCIKYTLIIDRNLQDYLVIVYGYEPPIVTGDRRTYTKIRDCVVHLAITGETITVYQDKLEDSIADELIEAGIPREKITIWYRQRDCVEYIVNARKIYQRHQDYFTADSDYQNPILKPNLTSTELEQLKNIDLEPINKAIALYEAQK